MLFTSTRPHSHTPDARCAAHVPDPFSPGSSTGCSFSAGCGTGCSFGFSAGCGTGCSLVPVLVPELVVVLVPELVVVLVPVLVPVLVAILVVLKRQRVMTISVVLRMISCSSPALF